MARVAVPDLWRGAAVALVVVAVAACDGTGGGGAGPASSAPERRCDGSALGASLGRATAATGHASRVLQLTNTSSRRCYLLGYPDVQRIDADAAPVPTRVVHGGGFSFPDRQPARVELAPRKTASFAADWAGATGYPPGCPESAKLLITPPAASGRISVDVPLQACPDGTIHVSPIVPGADGPAR